MKSKAESAKMKIMSDLKQINNNELELVNTQHPDVSRQYDLFSSFFGDASKLSNTIELWDAIPKYAVSARKQVSLRDEKGRLPVYRQLFVYRPTGRNNYPMEIEMRLQPASVEVDGVDKDFYPSSNEEIVEEVLRKIFTDFRYGQHQVRDNESWVQFTLRMLLTELKARDHTRSFEEVRRSLQIMGRCNVEIHARGDKNRKKVLYSAPILGDMLCNGRDSYLADPQSKWAARLPALISKSINKIDYRQFNYDTHLALKLPLSWWMHKRLCHNYTNANLTQPYNILFSTIHRDSGRLLHSKRDRNIKMVNAMWDELKDSGIILCLDIEEVQDKHGPDIKYTVTPTHDFVNEVKAANARQRNSLAEMGDPRAQEKLTRLSQGAGQERFGFGRGRE